eukprot:s281_g13.t1
MQPFGSTLVINSTASPVTTMVVVELASGSIFSKLACVIQLVSSTFIGALAVQEHFKSEEERFKSEEERRKRYADFIWAGAYTEEPLLPSLGSRLGGGLFGEVYLANRYGRQVAVKLPRRGGPMPPEPVLAVEFIRACRICHPNIVKPLERIAGATIWSFVGGEPWNLALRTSGVFRCQVAMQIASVVRYLARVHFIMWDVHQDDVLVRRDGHVTFLDIFMGPCENTGCLWSLPPSLRVGGPQRMQRLQALDAPAWHVNGFVAGMFLWSLAVVADVDKLDGTVRVPGYHLPQLLAETHSASPALLAAALQEVLGTQPVRPPPPSLPPPPAAFSTEEARKPNSQPDEVRNWEITVVIGGSGP